MTIATVPLLPGLRRIRLEAALSQRELAERSGVGSHTIVNLELLRCSARPSTMRKLAEALNCTPRELMAG